MAVLTTFLFLHSLYISYYQQPNYSHRLPSYCNTLFSLFVSISKRTTVVIINTTKITTLVRYSKHFRYYFLCFKTSFYQ